MLVRDNECPNGIYFKTPIPSKCLFFTKDSNNGKVIATYNEDACSPGSEQQLADGSDFTRLTDISIQLINISSSTTLLSVTGGSLAAQDCIGECFDEVEISKDQEDIESEPEYNDGIPPSTPAIEAEQIEISEKLFTFIMVSNEMKQRGKPEPRVFQLFNKVQRVFMKHCGDDYVSSVFMERVYAGLKWMVEKFDPFKVKDIGKHEFDVIDSILQKCLVSSKKTLSLSGTACEICKKLETIEISTSTGRLLETLTYKLGAKSFRWGKYDIFIEAAWSALDFVLNFCFDSFIPNLNHHHILQNHLETLFTLEVQKRWMYPTKLKAGDQYWNKLSGAGDTKWTMRNIDFCAQAASRVSPYDRLERPFSKADSSSVSSIGATTDITTGWTGSEKKYWALYNAKGGFKSAVKKLGGLCAQSLTDAKRYQKELESQCSKSNDEVA